MSRNGHFGFLGNEEMMDGLREEETRVRFDGMNGAFDAEDISLLRGIREDDAMLRLGDAGARGQFADSNADISGLREEASMLRLGDLRQDAARIVLGGMQADDSHITMGGAFDAEDIRILRGPVSVPHVNVDVDERIFRHQFRNDLEGVGRVNGLGGIFDIFTSLPEFTDFGPKMQFIYNRWTNARARLNKLSPQQNNAVIAQMTKMEAPPAAYERLPIYISEGSAGINRSRVSRVGRLETALPSVEKLISEMEATAPAPTAAQEQNKATEIVLKDVVQREQQAVIAATKGEMDLGKAATIGVVAVAGVGALYGIGKLLKIL